MKYRVILGLVAISLLLSSCGRSGSDSDSSIPRDNIMPNPNHSKSVFINDLRLEIATIKKEFPADEIVPLRVSVTNTGDKTVALTFLTGQKYDFSVTDSAGTEIWLWSKGRSFTQAVTAIKVKPGENYNYYGRVEAGSLKPGEYTAAAWITAEELLGEKISLKFKIVAGTGGTPST